jgi:DMSO reductase anchor subunit
MHPAFSVIFFTVVSGAGYGLLTLLAVFHVFGLAPMSANTVLTGGVIAVILFTAGLMASSFHLANPKNAWRAWSRFKTSWLSREAVFAMAVYPFAVLYLFGVWLQGVEIQLFFAVMGILAAVLSVITVFATGMIYGCLKTIRQWNTALTPANYILLGMALGGLLLATVTAYDGGYKAPILGITLAFLVTAAIMKAIYFFWIREVTGPTIKTATGFTRAAVRLLDTGHTAGTFLTEEFGYEAGATRTLLFKIGVFVLGFIVPIALLAGAMNGMGIDAARWAVVSAFIGIGLERWLFFAEARHVVNLYHGAQHT